MFSSFKEPKAIEGSRHAKYKKIIVVMYFPMALLLPRIPVGKKRLISSVVTGSNKDHCFLGIV